MRLFCNCLLLLILAFPSWAAAQPQPSIDATVSKFNLYIGSWQLDKAHALLQQLSNDDRSTVPGLFMQAYVDYYRGNYKNAHDTLERIVKRTPKPPAEMATMLELARASKEIIGKLRVKETEHFLVYYDEKRDGVMLPYTIETLESTYQALREEFALTPSEKIRIEILPRWDDFTKLSTLTEEEVQTSGTIGLCKFNKVMITSPASVRMGYPWRDTLAHELTHYFLYLGSKGNAPVWFHEGLAKLQEGLWRTGKYDELPWLSKGLLGKAVKKKELISFEAMYPSLAKLKTADQVQLAFAQVHSFLLFIAQTKGRDAIQRILADLSQGRSPRQSIATLFQRPFKEVYDEWQATLAIQDYEPIAWKEVPKIQLKQNRQKESEEDEIMTISSYRARDLVRLGDLLLGKKRYKASIKEYQKAFDLMGLSTPMVAVRLAAVYLQLGNSAKAIEILDSALRHHPHYPTAYLRLGKIYLSDGKLPRARQLLLQYIGIQPFNPEAHRLLAQIYSKQGLKDLAKQEERAATRLLEGRDE